MEWEKFRREIVGLQSFFDLFKAEFLDRDSFRKFADNLFDNVGVWNEVCITGYFSETIREALEEIVRIPRHRLRLICQEFDIKNLRDRKNLEVLKKLCKQGAEIKVNNRLHARFLVAYFSELPEIRGLLVIGSFDFNTECIGKERFDAGIKTTHPDLVKSAKKLFEEIWEEPESTPLLEKYPTEQKKEK